MKYDFHMVVIGAGSAGLVVASGAAGLGAKVALIEGHKMGGDCLNYGCVPSKAFLRPAHLASDIQRANELGLSASLDTVDAKAVMDRVRSVIAEIEPHDSVERYEGLGVTVFQGMGKILDGHTVEVSGHGRVTGKFIVIATGSTAAIPPIPGLDSVDYFTNHTIFNLETLPKHLIVLGAGPIGLELGQGFRHLGAEVSVIDRSETLFKQDEPEVGPLMKDIFQRDGLSLYLSSQIESLRSDGDNIVVLLDRDGVKQEISGDALLVSLGRRPVTDTLNLDAVGVRRDAAGYIKTSATLQTSVSTIYACGDVVGPYQFTHMAGYHAGLVIRNCLFPFSSKLNYTSVPWVTYTKPEVAHVGYTVAWAKKEGLYYDHILVDLNGIDRAKADHDRHGFLKLVLGKRSRIIGATMVGEKAGEMMPLVSLAIKQQLKASAFMGLIFSYPTQAEIFKFASLKAAKAGFKPWMKRLVKALFLR